MGTLNIIFFPNDSNPNHIKALDGIRGLAVLFVVLAHGSESGKKMDFFFNLQFLGQLGVFLFFVLSAFLLDMYISMSLIKGKANVKYWLNYVLRRFLRIYPLFFISLCIYWVSGRLGLIPEVIPELYNIKNHLLLSEEWAIYWSIGVELKYYLISPIILVICHKVLKWNRFLCIIFLILIILSSILIHSENHLVPFRFVNYLPFFIGGTVIALSDIYQMKRIDSQVLNIAIPISLFIILFGVSRFYDLFDFDGHTYNLLYLTYAIFITLFVYLVRKNHLIFTKILEYKSIRFIGNISYSLYLFHVLWLFLINQFGSDIVLLNTIAYLVFSIIFSSLTYMIIELPLSKIRLTNFNTKLNTNMKPNS